MQSLRFEKFFKTSLAAALIRLETRPKFGKIRKLRFGIFRRKIVRLKFFARWILNENNFPKNNPEFLVKLNLNCFENFLRGKIQKNENSRDRNFVR